jgi:folate-binding Fe-S cluster repair protein YgfZ
VQVFVTATGRCLDLATALVQDSGVLLLVSPAMKQQLLERFDKYIFPADKVAVADISPRTKMFTLLGPGAAEVLQEVAGVSRTIKLG